MRFNIKDRFCLFSHEPGVEVLLPFTDCIIKIFPNRWVVNNRVIDLAIQGPVKGFTVQQDIEKARLVVYGIANGCYFCFFLFAKQDQLVCLLDRYSKDVISYSLDAKLSTFQKKQEVVLPISLTSFSPGNERLSLGCYKAQNIDLMKINKPIKLLLPVWYRLSQIQPFMDIDLTSHQYRSTDLQKSVIHFFNRYFSKVSVPALEDSREGLPDFFEKDTNLIEFLQTTYLQIRQLFFMQDDNRFSILPKLPSIFNCGRVISLSGGKYGVIDFEWSKGRIRKLFFKSNLDASIYWDFSNVSSFRITSLRQGKKAALKAAMPVTVTKGESYLLDHFEK